MSVDGVAAIASFDTGTHTWSSETPSDSTATPMSTLVAAGDGVWVDRKSTTGLTLQAVLSSSTTPTSVSSDAIKQLPLITFVARDADHLTLVTTQSQIQDFDIATGTVSPPALVVEGIQPSVPMAGDSNGDVWAWRRTGTGDALVRIGAAVTTATDIDFHDATVQLDRNSAHGTAATSMTRFVDPAVQTITPTPFGVFVTTRYGSGGQEHSPYASLYVVQG